MLTNVFFEVESRKLGFLRPTVDGKSEQDRPNPSKYNQCENELQHSVYERRPVNFTINTPSHVEPCKRGQNCATASNENVHWYNDPVPWTSKFEDLRTFPYYEICKVFCLAIRINFVPKSIIRVSKSIIKLNEEKTKLDE